MADTTTTPATPDYSQKQFVQLDPSVSGWVGQLGQIGNSNATLDQIAHGWKGLPSQYSAIARQLVQGNGLANNLTVGQIQSGIKTPGFVDQYKLGQTFSYADLAKNALRADPNFDPSNTDAINQFAGEIQKRGYTNTDSADIGNLATNFALKNAVNSAQNPTQGKTADQLAGYNNSVKGVFNSVMGRDPTQNETDFFAKEIAGGTSPYELEQALQTSPEYVQKQNDIQSQKNTAASNDALAALNTNLLQTQQQAFKNATPQIIGSYMRAGRLNSSGVDSALANAQAQLDQSRQGFIANAGYQNAVNQQGYNQQGFVNNQNNAFNQYLRQNDPANQQRYAVNAAQNYNTFQAPLNAQQRTYGLADLASQRAYDLQNYQMQQNDYMNYLNSNKRSGASGALQGALAGGAAGASLGPWGALAGAGLGAFGGYQSTRY